MFGILSAKADWWFLLVYDFLRIEWDPWRQKKFSLAACCAILLFVFTGYFNSFLLIMFHFSNEIEVQGSCNSSVCIRMQHIQASTPSTTSNCWQSCFPIQASWQTPFTYIDTLAMIQQVSLCTVDWCHLIDGSLLLDSWAREQCNSEPFNSSVVVRLVSGLSLELGPMGTGHNSDEEYLEKYHKSVLLDRQGGKPVFLLVLPLEWAKQSSTNILAIQ